MASGFTPFPLLLAIKCQLVGNTILVAITVLVVALRVVTRLVTGSKLGWDDYLILAAVPQSIGMLVCQGLLSVTGVGYPLDDVQHPNTLYIRTILVPFEIIYQCLTVTARLSVLSFYLRVFTHGAVRTATKWMMVLVGSWGFGHLLQFILLCHVVKGQVDFSESHKCVDEAGGFVATGVFNCLTNFIIGLLPLYTIWSLKTVSVSTRLGLTAVFVLGTSMTVVSIYRVCSLAWPANANEPLVIVGLTTFLSVLETNLSIICNTLPMLLPLYSYWRYRKFYAEDEDEYVSRFREGDEPLKRRAFTFEDVTNGLPLETIYGQDNIHFTAAVGSGEAVVVAAAAAARRAKSKKARSIERFWTRHRGAGDPFEDSSDVDSTRRLGGSAGLTGITIEMNWTITEEAVTPKT